MADHFLILGHRGSPRRQAENTIASFEETVRSGADGFETDLRLLSDDVAVLFHDDEIGDDVFETLTLDEFKRRDIALPHVSQLAAFAGRTTMVLEVKRSRWEERLLREIRDWQNIIVASFDHSLIAELTRREVAFPLGLTVYGHIVDLPAYAKRLGATWIFPNFRYVSRDLVTELREAGMMVVPWTPNREREWDELRAAGCHGIITDLPAEAVAWRDRSPNPR
jgi:glycerophosphoryl diester phosphodiesterase